MALELFGFKLGRSDDEKKKAAEKVPSFVPPYNEDGAIDIAPGGAYGTTVDFEGIAKTEADLITRYRELTLQPEVENAVDDIINEAIVVDKKSQPVEIILDNVKLPDNIKNTIREEFENLLELLNFQNLGFDIFRRWYVDGRLYYHIMINEKTPSLGIQELRYIDPRRMRKVREPIGTKNMIPMAGGSPDQLKVPPYREWYLYKPQLAMLQTGYLGTAETRVSADAICYIHSGLFDQRNQMVLSYLHKAIKPMNQLRILEDATVIYRLARAPERRVFYIDVGSLPKQKAEQYVRDMMVRHKNRLVYDANTGEVRDDRKFMTMLEDFWLPRREGTQGTKIETLPAGQNLAHLEDVEYFKKRLYKALNVPTSRLDGDGAFNLGRSSEITRDELKFAKFIVRLRNRFSHLFDNLLEIHLSLKGVMRRADWQDIRNDVSYDFLQDSFFTESKDGEVLKGRIGLLDQVTPYIGKFYSRRWVQDEILQMSEDDIAEMELEIAEELANTDLQTMTTDPIVPGMPAMPGKPQQPSAGAGAKPTSGAIPTSPQPIGESLKTQPRKIISFNEFKTANSNPLLVEETYVANGVVVVITDKDEL